MTKKIIFIGSAVLWEDEMHAVTWQQEQQGAISNRQGDEIRLYMFVVHGC